MYSENRLKQKQLQEAANKRDISYQNKWSAGMPSVWAHEKVEEAIKLNYVPPRIQNNYQNPITREEFAELFVTAIFEAVNNRNSEVSQNIKKTGILKD